MSAPRPDTQPPAGLSTPVTALSGVGPKSAERLARLGIHSVLDLLFHLPLRYQDRTQIRPIGSLVDGTQTVIEGTIDLSQVRIARRRSLLVHVSDNTGAIVLRFFHFSRVQQDMLSTGNTIRCFGEVRRGPKHLEMVHPEFQILNQKKPDPLQKELTPIYPTTERLHQITLRKLSDQALAILRSSDASEFELMPQSILSQYHFPNLSDALHTTHRPAPDTSIAELLAGNHPARRRLAFEELLAHHLSMLQLRENTRRHPAPALDAEGDLVDRFTAALPFTLTGAQQRVIAEIRRDIAEPIPMLRLLQGDVGSGKTAVAVTCALQAIQSGGQVALMAPTELLTEQHLRTLSAWLDPLGVSVGWLSGKMSAAKRAVILQAISDGSAQLVIGTHALFQNEVVFANLALIIIDEQHRFGVHQRMALREKGDDGGQRPHQLIMTATPIPRTLAMTAYADLDVSVLDELPPGRKLPITAVMPDTRRDDIIDRIRSVCHAGAQVYWVCTLIDESEAIQCKAASDTSEDLTLILDDLRVGLVHGRMKPADKESVMRSFSAGDIDVLVATTVIEVGVDVPNASLMIIENSERLGLAQLHQLRGRIGRGQRKGHCVMLYQGKLSESAHARLAVMRETTDGFEIARRDLELRGPGELLGTRQTGLLQMRIADLFRDQAMLPDVQRAAREVLEQYPANVQPLIQRWLGNAIEYGDV